MFTVGRNIVSVLSYKTLRFNLHYVVQWFILIRVNGKITR